MWGSLTGFYRQRSAITFLAGATDYNVVTVVTPTDLDCFAVLRIDAATYHLDPISINEIGIFTSNWTQDTSATPIQWIPLGLNKIALYPILTTNITAYVDNLYYATIPLTDADYIQLGEEDMDALIDYCQFAATIKEGGAELQAAMPLLKNFLSNAAKYNSKLQHSATFRRILGMPGGGQENQRPASDEVTPFR